MVDAITKLGAVDPAQLRDVVATLRATIEVVLKRRNRLVAASYLSGAVQWAVWVAGDQRTAVLLGKFASLQYSFGDQWAHPSFVDAESLGVDTIAEIEAEAARLDFDTAGAIALAALDRILGSD